MSTKKFKSLYEKEYEIKFRERKNIPDMESRFYRFQIIKGNNAFGYDFTITDKKVKRYNLNENEIIIICFCLIGELLNSQIEEYCSVQVGKDDIVEYLKVTRNIERFDDVS